MNNVTHSGRVGPDEAEVPSSMPLADVPPSPTEINRTNPSLLKVKTNSIPVSRRRTRRRKSRSGSDAAALINRAFGWHLHPRNGKVARLPEVTRNAINLMLDDGVRYRDIIVRLQKSAAEPLPYSISEMNLSNWFRGGYQEWCRMQFEDKVRREFESRIERTKAAASASPITPDVTKCHQMSPNVSI